MADVRIQGVAGGERTDLADTDTLEGQLAGDAGSFFAQIGNIVKRVPKCLILAVTEEGLNVTQGTAQVRFRMPWAYTLTEVRASVATAPTGQDMQVDINEGGVSVLSTVITIDANEKTSTTAVNPPVISDASLADDAEITIDVDQVGTTTPGAGLKVYLIGRRT